MVTYDDKIKRLEFNDRTDRLMQVIKLYKEKKVEQDYSMRWTINNEWK